MKAPVEGTIAPIGVPLMEPPEMVALDAVRSEVSRLANEPLMAFRLVPDAVPKPIQVLVVPIAVRLVMEALFTTLFVKFPLTANRLVLVVLVPVALVQMRLAKEDGEEPFTVKLAMVAFCANKFVVVALVVVVSPKIACAETRFGAFKLIMVPDRAFMAVPDAVANPNHAVDVPLVKVRLSMVPLVANTLFALILVEFNVAMVAVVAPNVVAVTDPAVTLFALNTAIEPLVDVKFVTWPSTANRFVAVVFVSTTLVPVAFVQTRLVKNEGAVDETVKLVTAKFVTVAFEANKF